MTCKDCVHYNVCGYHIDEETFMTTEECSHFKNKADFVEVKHGEWRICCDGYYPYCSNCGYEPPWVANKDMRTPHCPICGADMRKEGADNG